MSRFSAQLEKHEALNQMLVPDLWQHEAISKLRDGMDVIVSAPTGSGKTLIFELWAKDGKSRGQAVYTVPTRALANDKLAEWRQKGWNVGIATGDLSENLDAPIIVGTLEAQKNRILEGRGPKLLVIDEYQMIGDDERGLNYELTIAQAPASTQLLLLSGSVNNPQHLERWLNRLGRKAVTVSHAHRPVPLEEVFPLHLHHHVPKSITSYWGRFVASALLENLGPILIFAPRRAAAEKLAKDLARQLPAPDPLVLTEDQKRVVGDSLTRTLSSRIAFHHSGLSYAARAGVIEPLAKAGQLRVVVATMGLAAGINFSLRSVALAADSYRRNYQEQSLSPDEILQMIGRAGRRGIDETGFVLVGANQIRMRDAYPIDLARSQLIDWSTLLRIMNDAAQNGASPFRAAISVQKRLYTTKPIYLGVEVAMEHPDAPCHLPTDPERARMVRSQVSQFLNSHGEWEDLPHPKTLPASKISVPAYPDEVDSTDCQSRAPSLIPLLSSQTGLAEVTLGPLIRLGDHESAGFGQLTRIADHLEKHRILLNKRLRRFIKWKGRYVSRKRWDDKIVPLIKKTCLEANTPLVRFHEEEKRISMITSIADQSFEAFVDQHGIALWRPLRRKVQPAHCRSCHLNQSCHTLMTTTTPSLLWRRFQLIDENGIPTRRGQLVSFFSHGDGLAIAASVEDETYPLDSLIFDMANLDGGFRFSGEDNRWAGRMAEVCRNTFGPQNIQGYLENGYPPNYGFGAAEIVRSIYHHPHSKHQWETDILGVGDIDRIVIEWRSRLRQISNAPALQWDRWEAFRNLCRETLNETVSPSATSLPEISHEQRKRVSHRLHPSQFKSRHP